MADIKETPLLVIGGGPGGYPAAFAAADHGISSVLVDMDPRLGGVCLNRGCIPSKALLHIAKLIEETREASHMGVKFSDPVINLDELRQFVQQKVVGKLTGGIQQLARARGVETIRGKAIFEDPHTVRVEPVVEGDTPKRIRFQNAIIATGSSPVMPRPFMLNDPRIMDSTGALLLPDVPKRMLIIGGGYIGLEIGTVYAALGTKIVVVELLDGLLPLADRDLVKPLEDRLRKRFEAIYLNTKVASLTPQADGILANLEGKDVPASSLFDRVLISVGRRPNSNGLGLEAVGITVNERGFIPVDLQRRTQVPHILAIGDVSGEPGLAHKATAEAKVAVETILGEPSEFSPRAIPAVVFTDPELAWCGATERELKEQNVPFDRMDFPWAASGRATTLARNEGKTKIMFDPQSGRILGVGIVGVNAGEMIAEGVLAMEVGAVARDLAETIHPHPTLSETIMEASELALGGATHIFKPKSAKR